MPDGAKLLLVSIFYFYSCPNKKQNKTKQKPYTWQFETTQFWYLVVLLLRSPVGWFVGSITRLKSEWRQAEPHSFLEAHGEIPFLGTLTLFTDWVSHGCRTESPISLLKGYLLGPRSLSAVSCSPSTANNSKVKSNPSETSYVSHQLFYLSLPLLGVRRITLGQPTWTISLL